MAEWFYAREGRQEGPVSFEKLTEIARGGGLNPDKDLVWTTTMKDWTPAGKVEGLFGVAPQSVVPADPSNPYAAPQTQWMAPAPVNGPLAEIIPGSEPIDAVECVKRAFELTKRQFGNILLVGLVYFAVYIGASFAIGLVSGLLTIATQGGISPDGRPPEPSALQLGVSTITQLVLQVISMFLSLGLTRVALNLVSGGEVSVGQLFGEGDKLLRAIGATILYMLMVMVGLVLLIVPGIYLALRYGQYLSAIVDRNLGVFESFSYSSSLTTNNRGQLFVLALLGFLLAIAGMLACFVGLIFTGPIAWLSWIVAYRWMQYGRLAAADHPGTVTPMLRQF
jgi:uncharacterized membrane protein